MISISSKIALVDIDDTILHCSDALEAFCENKLGMKSHSRLRDHYYVHHIFDIDQETAERVCQEFWTSDTFYNLKPMACALEVLPRLYAQGWRFVAITACLDHPIVKAARLKNLVNAFGFPWEDVWCTYGSEKAEHLVKYEPTIWVEDHWHNCQSGAKLGHKAFLINKTYNAIDHEEPLFTRVTDWYEVEAHINRLEE